MKRCTRCDARILDYDDDMCKQCNAEMDRDLLKQVAVALVVVGLTGLLLTVLKLWPT